MEPYPAAVTDPPSHLIVSAVLIDADDDDDLGGNAPIHTFV
jgi:hypothetical protein